MGWILRPRFRAQTRTRRPEANSEYSRGCALSAGVASWPDDRHRRTSGADFAMPGTLTADRVARWIPAAILVCALFGAALVLVAEFTTLFDLRASAGTVKTIGTGSHHSYAFVPVALLAGILGVAAWRTGSRPALFAIGALGAIVLLISLLGDLPDAHRSGLIRTSPGHFAGAATKPGAGLYLETLGGVVLLITSVSGLLLASAPTSSTQRAATVPPGRRAEG